MEELLCGRSAVVSKELKICAFPRIHVSLLDLSGTSSRKYGGAGFAIEGAPICVTVRRANTLTVSGIRKFDAEARLDIEQLLDRLQSYCAEPLNIELRVTQSPPQHIGLGTKTSMVLGISCAVSRFLGHEVDRDAIQRLSHRGGTSGVGIHAFFDGGFVVDLGHPKDTSNFTPSRFGKPESVPLLCKRVAIPENWRFALIVPDGNRLSGSAESTFFADNSPIPPSEAIAAIALVYHGVLPSVMTGDLATLTDAIAALQVTGFKRREILAQRPGTQELIHELMSAKVGAVGMSSLGPLVYAIVDINDREASRRIVRLTSAASAQLLGFFPGNNTGYRDYWHA